MKTLVFLSSLLLATVAHADPLKFVTEEYPPFSYREAGAYKGASIDQVDLLMKDAGLQYSLEMMPWARALALAETQDTTCVFTTVHNKERDKHFKWVEPLLIDRTILVRRSGSGVEPGTLAEATKFVVGTQRGDFTADILKEKNFPKVDLASDFNLTLKKLLAGRIDLMPVSEKYYDKLKREGVRVDNVLLLTEQIYSIACNKSVADQDIARMQTSLSRLIHDGTQDKLFRQYGLEQQSN